MTNRVFFIIFLLLAAFIAKAQDNPGITIKGKVYDSNDNEAQYNLMVLNKTGLVGVFGDRDGRFTITCHKNDSLVLNAVGYQTVSLSFRDSVVKKEYHPLIALEPIRYELKQVSVFSKRDLNEIQKDIEKLGYDKKDYVLSGIDAIQSPITFLYETFSKRERSRRLVAQMENEDQKRELLKELFRQYVDADIINLDNDEFDNFIDFCHVSEEFMKHSTQYEFCVYIRGRYYEYRNR